MGSDSSWIRELDRNWIFTGPGSSLDLDRNWIFTGSSLDLDRNWIFTGSSLDLDRNWIFTGSSLELDRNWTFTGTGLVSRIDGIGLVVDPGTGTYVSESDRWDRTRSGSGNLTGT